MITKPSMFDIKYQNMNQEETLLNYERDLMLWEQTEALKNMNSNSHNSSNINMTATEGELHDVSVNAIINSSKNPFKYGSDLYIKYDRLAEKSIKYANRAEFFSTHIKGLLFFIFAVLVCFCLPLALLQSDVSYRILVAYVIGLNIIAFIVNHFITKHYINKAREANYDTDNFEYKYREYKEKREY